MRSGNQVAGASELQSTCQPKINHLRTHSPARCALLVQAHRDGSQNAA
jgi:hypothetical protein